MGATTKAGKMTLAKRTGLKFPVARISKELRTASPRISRGAGVVVAGAVEYCVRELMHRATAVLKDGERKKKLKARTLKPRHLLLAAREDADLDVLLQHVHIQQGGVRPAVHGAIEDRKVKPRTSQKKKVKEEQTA